MIAIDKLGWPAAIARKIAPTVGPALSSNLAQNALSLMEVGAAIFRGKGAGTGWDMSSEVRVASPFVGDDSIVFDVGANTGEWSRTLIEACTCSPQIFLFEPQESCVKELEKLPKANCTIVRAAVGDRPETRNLYSPGERAGNASLYDRTDSYFVGGNFVARPVKIFTIDSFMTKNAIDRVDYMKIDVEGHEMAVLKGSEKAVSREMIGAITFEFGSANIYSRTFFRDFWDFFNAYGYKISRITPGGKLVEVNKYYEDLEYFRGATNYIAILSPGSTRTMFGH
jgi:FkbM family methyltransferase